MLPLKQRLDGKVGGFQFGEKLLFFENRLPDMLQFRQEDASSLIAGLGGISASALFFKLDDDRIAELLDFKAQGVRLSSRRVLPFSSVPI